MVFRSAAVEQFAGKWGISMRFRTVYALSGNIIVERNTGQSRGLQKNKN